MIRALLIYNEEDYKKNIWFANHIIKVSKSLDIEMSLVFSNQIKLKLKNDKFYINIFDEDIKNISFIINRTRDSIIAKHFENMGIRVYNTSYVTDICNNKIKTHLLINKNNVSSIDSMFFNKSNFKYENIDIKFPVIIKSISGYGGKEVFIAQNELVLKKSIENICDNNFIIQKLSKNFGKDIRVFVIGNKIIGSVLRYNDLDFKANISLGGKSKRHTLNKKEENLVMNILDLFEFDFVGIDFILDENNNLLFNEIEDVVGTRSFYHNYNTDIIKIYLDYIKKDRGMYP